MAATRRRCDARRHVDARLAGRITCRPRDRAAMVPLARADQRVARADRATIDECRDGEGRACRLEGVQAESRGFVLDEELTQPEPPRERAERMERRRRQIRPRRKERPLPRKIRVREQIVRRPHRRHVSERHFSTMGSGLFPSIATPLRSDPRKGQNLRTRFRRFCDVSKIAGARRATTGAASR